MASSFMAPKRKPVPPPLLPKRPETNGSTDANPARSSPKPPLPPLPDRRKRQSSTTQDDESESEVLVVEAPTESAPTSPAVDENEHHDEFFGHGESTAIEEQVKPPLPVRRGDNTPPDLSEDKGELQRQEMTLYT